MPTIFGNMVRLIENEAAPNLGLGSIVFKQKRLVMVIVDLILTTFGFILKTRLPSYHQIKIL